MLYLLPSAESYDVTLVAGVPVVAWAEVVGGGLLAGVLAGLELVSGELTESDLAAESPLLVDSLPAGLVVAAVVLVEDDLVRLSVL